MAHKNLYDIQDGKIIRKKRNCPKCGEGTFLGQHKNRESCGKCGYTEFTKKEKSPPSDELLTSKETKAEPLTSKETEADKPAEKSEE